MIDFRKFYLLVPAVLLLNGCHVGASSFTDEFEESERQRLPAWTEGTLDIHHISTGRGNAAYMIFPDGTQMMFDVGDLGVDSLENHPIMKVAEVRPNNSKQPGEWIAEYVLKTSPKNKPLKIDYVAISHFHADHYGNAEVRSKRSASGEFVRTGVTELGDLIPIQTLIDRAYPNYDSPANLSEHYGKTFDNYLAFIKEKQTTTGLKVEALVAGSDDQIILKYKALDYPDFSVRNVKSNGTIWSGKDSETFDHLAPKEILNDEGGFNENPLSLALEVSYGSFDYFTGGDMTGLQGFGLKGWFDVETPVAGVVGQVDVLNLNHHGNRDATNENFLKALAPRIIVQQSWISDHPGGEVMHRMASEAIYPGPRDIFSTSMQEETKTAIGTWMVNAYKSFEGHIVIRVKPGGQQYSVYVLDDRSPKLHVKAVYGPYISN
ncbi:MAG: beta-lactamase superfamily II metal-dependent hydrolase [Arenicella sp.]|jgi:beta-lactamase superfamily II metal-dependent hydrolase